MNRISKRAKILLAVLPMLALIVGLCFPIGNVQAKAATKISKCKIVVKDAVLKNGVATPTVKVTYNNKTLKKGTDYTVTLKNNKDYGTATCVIKGKNAYSGSVTKKFNVVPGKVAKFRYEYATYEDGTEAEIFHWASQPEATGYSLYISTAKNGKYVEVSKIAAEEWNEMTTSAQYGVGNYAKLKSYVYKNGKYYYGAFTKAVKIAGNGKSKTSELKSYKVTAKNLTAPSGVKVVYDSQTSIYDKMPESLCLQFTNTAAVTVKDWYIEFYDKSGVDIGTANVGLEAKAGETVKTDISYCLMDRLYPGLCITKIRIIPMDGGNDGWTSGPWYNEMSGGQRSDDTFGEATVFNCNIKGDVVDKGTLTGSFFTPEWGGLGVRFGMKKGNYDYVDVKVSTNHGGYGQGASKNENGDYVVSFYDDSAKADIKDCNSFVTITAVDYSTLKITGDNEATLTCDRYFLSVK